MKYFTPKIKKPALEQGKIMSINKLTGRVGVFIKNGLVSAASYLYDISELRVGMSVLVGRVSNTYVIMNKMLNVPRAGRSYSLARPASIVNTIGNNWAKVYDGPIYDLGLTFWHLYYLGNGVLITSDTGDSALEYPSLQLRSIDNGDTWISNEVTDYPGKFNMINLGNGVLIALYYGERYGAGYECQIVRSVDYGVTWQSVYVVPLTGLGYITGHGDILYGKCFCDFKDGTIVFWINYVVDLSGGYKTNRTIIAFSHDYGANWELALHLPSTGYSTNSYDFIYMRTGKVWGNYQTMINGPACIKDYWFTITSSGLDTFLDDAVEIFNNEQGVFSKIVQISDTVACAYTSTDKLWITNDEGENWTENITLPRFYIDERSFRTNYFSKDGTTSMEIKGGPYTVWTIRGISKIINVQYMTSHNVDHSIIPVTGTDVWLGVPYDLVNVNDRLLFKSASNGLYWESVSNNGYPIEGCREIVDMGSQEFCVLSVSDRTQIWKHTPTTPPYEPPPDGLTGYLGLWSINLNYDYSLEAPTVVYNGSFLYGCTATHTSSSDNEPGVGANWENYWEAVLPFTGIWELSHSYVGNADIVDRSLHLYMCMVDNISSSDNEPGAGANWETYWELLI
jgi:hypothetical protein